MDILVFSDSHGDVAVMERIVASRRPDRVLHLGDHHADLERLHDRFPEIPMQGVRGNCDTSGPDSLRLELGPRRLLLVHGHRQGVKEGLERLYFTAVESRIDLVLFGHTHRPLREREGNVEFFNPGSVGRGWPPSYGVLHVSGPDLETEIVYL